MNVSEVEIKYSKNMEIWELAEENNLEFRLTRDSFGYNYQVTLYNTLRKTTIAQEKMKKKRFLRNFIDADNYKEVLRNKTKENKKETSTN